MLTTALATNPATPPDLVCALTDRAALLARPQVLALAAHPNLPGGHLALTGRGLGAALTHPATPPDRAATIAAAQPLAVLTALLRRRPPLHPAAVANLWSRRHEHEWTTTDAALVARCPTTPPDIAREAILAATAGQLTSGHSRSLAWAAAAHPDLLTALAGTCTEPGLISFLHAAAGAPDARQYVLHQWAARAGDEGPAGWGRFLALCADPAAELALASSDPDVWPVVLADTHVDPHLRARALRAIATCGRQHLRLDMHTLDAAAVADHLTGQDLTVMTAPGALPVSEWPWILTGAHLSGEDLTAAWHALAATTEHAEVTDEAILDLTLTIATHPAAPGPLRAHMQTVAGLHLPTGTRHWYPARAVHAALNAPGGLTRVPLTRLRPADLGAHDPGGNPPPPMANLARALSRALTPGLCRLAEHDAGAVAGRLLGAFAGSWDDLVDTAITIAT